MTRKSSTFFFLLVTVLLLSGGCNNETKNRDFVIPANHPAVALTIGWYVPVNVMEEIVGEHFKPKVVRGDDRTAVMLYITESDEHVLDGKNRGVMRAAYLVIPVEPADDITIPRKAGNLMACPVTIVDRSAALGDKYNAFGFPTYAGQITLNVEQSDGKYNVDATVKTVNGSIVIKGMFDKEGKSHELNSAIYTTKQGFRSFFHGEEKFHRIEGGKGNLKLDGQNIISAMQLDKLPYFLTLDRDVTWAFNFVK